MADAGGSRARNARAAAEGCGAGAAWSTPSASPGSAPAALWDGRRPVRAPDGASPPRGRGRAAVRGAARARTSRRRCVDGRACRRRSRSCGILVRLQQEACRLVPRVVARAAQPGRTKLLSPRDRLLDAGRDRLDVLGIDENGRAAGDLLGGAAPRRHDRRPTRHRHEDRDPEPLVQRRVHDAERAAIQARELLVRGEAHVRDARTRRVDAAPARHACHPQVDAQPPRRFDRAGEVLARLERPHRENVVAVLTRAVAGEGGIGRVRNDADALARNMQDRLQFGRRELRHGGDDPRGAHDARDHCTAVRARPRRERLRAAEDGEVVHADDERDTALHRAAVGRAVEHVSISRTTRQHVRVPREVEPERSGPARGEAAQPLHLHLALDAWKKRAEIPRCPSTRELERRDVDGDPHRADSQAARCAVPFASHVKRIACSIPRGTRSPRSATARSIPAAIASTSSGSARTAASPAASSSDGCEETTHGVPHAIASITGMPNPSNRDGYTNARAPRYRRGSSSSGGYSIHVAPGPRASTPPHPRGPTMRSSMPSRSAAAIADARFLRGSSVPTASRYSPSARGPSGVNASPTPGYATWMRERSTPSVSATSSPVNSELTMTTSQARAACRYLAACMLRVLPWTQPGKCSGTRSCTIVERMPARWGGYIQSPKWKTSSRPTNASSGGAPRRDHAVRS